MKASVKQQSKNKLVGVVLRSGELITKTSISGVVEPCTILGLYGATCVTPVPLEAWAKQKGSTPVYEGDTVTLEF